MQEGPDFFRIEAAEVLKRLETSRNGLSSKEAAKRIEQYGLNEIVEVKGRPLYLKFLENFYHLFAILLWVGGILAFFAQQPQLGWAVFIVIFINAVFSFWQEFKAEKATEELKKLLPPKAKVQRDDRIEEVLAKDIVPGDILVLGEGDYVPADGRVMEHFELRTNDSALTGEAHPAPKISDVMLDPVSVTEAPNMVFAGTTVLAGSGKAIAVATGMQTQFGKIAALTQSVKEELSPLQKEMQFVTKVVGALAIGLGIIFFFVGEASGLPFSFVIPFAIGIIVANIPEGLLPTVTLALAMGVQRMAKRHALIKKLSSVETLGCTTIICTDKTGTLTQNEMTVREIWVNRQSIDVTGSGYEPKGDFLLGREQLSEGGVRNSLEVLLKTAALANSAKMLPPKEKKKSWSILGDPTEGALLVATAKSGIDLDKLYSEGFLRHQLPFESVRKRMSSVYQYADTYYVNQYADGTQIAYIKGAPKEMLELCNRIYLDGEIKDLDDVIREEVLKANDDYAKASLRVLALAYKQLPDTMSDYTVETVESDMVFIGLMAMMDPPRSEVQDAVVKCHTAGIRIIMITGDYGLTAEAIARKIGIVLSDARIITGVEFDKLSDRELLDVMEKEEVIFARVAPEHKMRVVSILKDAGEIVAVTGDGVNDAPALKKADIGVAMGVAGTDVAKEAAEMILTDDNFASIVNAIEEGRAVYDNIRRFVTYIFASNIPEIVPFIAWALLKLPIALTVMQILAIDLGTDMVPALALGTERPEPGVMKKPPRPRKERLLNLKVIARAYFFLGILQTTVCFIGYFYVFNKAGYALPEIIALGTKPIQVFSANLTYMRATTAFHIGVISTQIGNAFAVRTSRDSVFSIGFFSNTFLLWGILVEVLGIIIFVYVEPFQSWFNHAPVSLSVWLLMFAFVPTLWVGDEIRKFFVRRFFTAKR
jgi:Ca2+-transporting ATPase